MKAQNCNIDVGGTTSITQMHINKVKNKDKDKDKSKKIYKGKNKDNGSLS